MKTLLTLLIPFLLTGCYTELKLSYPYDYQVPSNRSEYYDQYGNNVDQEYNDDYESGFQDGVQVFRDQQVANRWSPYYNRFYWVDPFWSGPNYDAFLWDPYFGYYGSWGISYYGYYSNYFSVYPSYGWGVGFGWANRWNYPPNVIFVGGGGFGHGYDNSTTRWAYGPRDFGNELAGSSRRGVRSSDPYANSTSRSRKSLTSGSSPRKSNPGYSIPSKGSSGSSRGSSGVTRPSRTSGKSSGSSVKKSGSSSSSSKKSSSSSSSARPSRSGKN